MQELQRAIHCMLKQQKMRKKHKLHDRTVIIIIHNYTKHPQSHQKYFDSRKIELNIYHKIKQNIKLNHKPQHTQRIVSCG